MKKIVLDNASHFINYNNCFNYNDGSFITISLSLNNLEKKSVDVEDLEKTLLKTLGENKSALGLMDVTYIIKTIFKDFKETSLLIETGKNSKVTKSVCYQNAILTKYVNSFDFDSETFLISYQQEKGFNFSITDQSKKDLTYSYHSEISKRLEKEMNRFNYFTILKGKNELTDEEKCLYKAYALFYNEPLDFRIKDSVRKAQVMVYILSEYNITIGEKFYFSPIKNYPHSLYLDQLIRQLRPLGKVKKEDYDISFYSDAQERIKIIGELIRNYIKQFSQDELSTLTEISSIIYTKNYILSLFSTNEEVAAKIGCDEESVQKCMRLVTDMESI